MTNQYSIDLDAFGSCEHAEIECVDADATADDMIMLPNTFLRVEEVCGMPAEFRMIIADQWTEAMGAEPDEYQYCRQHAYLMLQNLDPGAELP